VSADPGLAGATVTTHPPDRARTGGGLGRQINLFLYQVLPNTAWSNMDLPFRNDGGQLVNQPVLALDLHYLVTVYGQNDDALDEHHLLAFAMSLLHDRAILTPDRIQAAVLAQPEIAGSDLADQIELVRLCPQSLTQDEMFKLWSAFQTNYRLSVAYTAAVVLIDRPVQTSNALPVRAPNVYAIPFRAPTIESLSPQLLPPGGTLTIQGQHLQNGVVEVHIGTAVVAPTSLTNTQIQVTVPATLEAGVKAVQVVQQLLLGTPPAPHKGFSSNVMPFILTPQITTPAPINATGGATLTLGVTPPVTRLQQVTLLLGDQAINVPPRPATGPASTSSLDFPIPTGFPPGSYLLRLRVDGAESPLTSDPNSGAYTGPTVTIT
jgi:hypothetical protein